MKILIDMNLSPEWVDWFTKAGIEAIHWTSIGSPKAKDREIMEYALRNEFIIFTHDLDFGAILAATNANSPSVLQIRSQETLVKVIGNLVLKAIADYKEELETGALVTLDMQRSRVRILPIKN